MRHRGRRTCDVLLVDGDHSEVGTRYDINALGAVVREGSTLVVDDTVPVCLSPSVEASSGGPLAIDEADAAHYCNEVRAVAQTRKDGRDARIVGPGWAVRKLAHAGRIRVTERYGPFMMGTSLNPCFRAPRRRRCHAAADEECFRWCGAPHEFDWGFVVARYLPFVPRTT